MHLLRALALVSLVATGCGGGKTAEDNDPFDTYQACFDDHHGGEGFDVQTAIKICCIDHPIGDQAMNVVCGESSAACVTFVTANLASPDIVSGDIQAACDGYIQDRGQ
jgi:hypothetical protein